MTTAFLIHSRLVWYQWVRRSSDDVVLARLAQVERLDGDPLDLESDVSSPPCGIEIEPARRCSSKQIGQQRSAPSDRPMLRSYVRHGGPSFVGVIYS